MAYTTEDSEHQTMLVLHSELRPTFALPALSFSKSKHGSDAITLQFLTECVYIPRSGFYIFNDRN